MEPILCYPAPPPEEIQEALNADGYTFVGANDAATAMREEPDVGYLAAVISAVADPIAGFDLCRSLRKRETPVSPLLLVIDQKHVSQLSIDDDLFDDFLIVPIDPEELGARLSHLLWRTGRGKQHDLIVYGPLELLRFLAAHPGSVFTREVLLSRVWGYEYFGGARTVDVHIRRLRAKLGEEHASLIETVRSVGYRFGRVRWSV
jgi:DNA-binding response OmpR family regulator